MNIQYTHSKFDAEVDDVEVLTLACCMTSAAQQSDVIMCHILSMGDRSGLQTGQSSTRTLRCRKTHNVAWYCPAKDAVRTAAYVALKPASTFQH